MSTAEKIFSEAQRLPEEAQTIVLQIIELMASPKGAGDDEEWTEFSIANALEGMENESWPNYEARTQFEKWR